MRGAFLLVLILVLLVFVWITVVVVIGGGAIAWELHVHDDALDNGAWLVVGLLGLLTLGVSAALGRVFEWSRLVVLRILPPAILFVATVALAWLVPSRHPEAGRVALQLEAAAAGLYLAAIVRACWRDLARAAVPRAKVSPRR